MRRALATALLCAAAVLAADIAFRTSLLHLLRPVIVSPADQAVLSPPVQVRWEGPTKMRVLLSIAGEERRDLGVRESPVDLGADELARDGGYEVELCALQFGDWIHATRRFQVHGAAPPPTPRAHAEPQGVRNLFRALHAARRARDKAHARTRFLSEENAALRDESERLSRQLEALYEAQEDEAARVTELEKYAAQLGEENRTLSEENSAIRQRLNSVVPCTVWGYYSLPRSQGMPVTRRFLMVSDGRGQVFRAQAECELMRRTDSTAASICFCVGNSWGG
jgi:regulator of replication initiation timing